jgi:branched-chain amino acid transport system ATP-binding protein
MAQRRRRVLEIAGLKSAYGRIEVLHGIDLAVAQGEIVTLVGANGAGKTTLMRVISGIQPASAGSIRFEGQDLLGFAAHRRVGLGIALVPEGRQIFAPLTVEDNLRLGAWSRRGADITVDLERVFELFPILAEKRGVVAGGLSGGQQQMLAIGRALMSRPRLILLDEPSMGLAPVLVDQVFSIISRLKADGLTVLVVEQNAAVALSMADRGYVVETGLIAMAGEAAALRDDPRVKAAYLGI